MPTARPLVLDTHVFLWLLAGHPALPGETRDAMAAAARRGDLLVPAIVPWEIAMLAARGRIALAEPAAEFIAHGLDLPGIRLAPLTPEVAVEAVALPGGFHKDPADRMIVATARVLGGTLVTFDQAILDWAAKGHVLTA